MSGIAIANFFSFPAFIIPVFASSSNSGEREREGRGGWDKLIN